MKYKDRLTLRKKRLLQKMGIKKKGGKEIKGQTKEKKNYCYRKWEY